MSQVKTIKVGDLSDCGSVMRDRLLALMKDVWNEGRVVDACRDALIVPVPKKSNLQFCDNWCGISLLDFVGVIAKGWLPDSQCGFRKGGGCTDMIFATRQLMEKTREHGDRLFLLFVDLKKAYDSVPRPAM